MRMRKAMTAPVAGVRRLREVARALLTERLTPHGAAGAVFVGVFVGIVPIYGFQSIVAITLATLLRLNKPLTFGATFVNNPLLQPFLVFGSIELGHLTLHGRWLTLRPSAMRSFGFREHLAPWLAGSLILGAAAGAACAAVAFAIVARRSRRVERARSARFRRYAAQRFRSLGAHDRRFVAWKVRLDRLFNALLAEELGTGTVVDLGCGYGEVLALAAFGDERRELYGCDLDAGRIDAARRAFADLHSRFEVADVRTCALPRAGLILLIDVLQYLEPAEQEELLRRCAAALEPGGRLILRVHDLDRGWMGHLTTGFDRVVFRAGGFRRRPVHLAVAAYCRTLGDAGLAVREQPMRNRLPLVHSLLIASRPEAS